MGILAPRRIKRMGRKGKRNGERKSGYCVSGVLTMLCGKLFHIVLIVGVFSSLTGCATTTASSGTWDRAVEHVRRQNYNDVRFARW